MTHTRWCSLAVASRTSRRRVLVLFLAHHGEEDRGDTRRDRRRVQAACVHADAGSRHGGQGRRFRSRLHAHFVRWFQDPAALVPHRRSGTRDPDGTGLGRGRSGGKVRHRTLRRLTRHEPQAAGLQRADVGPARVREVDGNDHRRQSRRRSRRRAPHARLARHPTERAARRQGRPARRHGRRLLRRRDPTRDRGHGLPRRRDRSDDRVALARHEPRQGRHVQEPVGRTCSTAPRRVATSIRTSSKDTTKGTRPASSVPTSPRGSRAAGPATTS